MDGNKDFDLDSIMDKLSFHLEDAIEIAVADHIESAVASAIEDTLPNALEGILADALNETLLNFEFVLNDGTIVRQRPRMKLLYPDKSRSMPCYGGLYINGTCLMVQIAPSSWDEISFATQEDALAALNKIKDAMNDQVTLLEL